MILDTWNEQIGLILGLGMDKCATFGATLAVGRGKVKPTEDIVLSEDQIIEALENNMLLLYTKQNTDRMLKFDWLRAGPYACVPTDVWTG